MISAEVGELIENRYRVLAVIGAGEMGVLYQVSDEGRAGELMALKTIRTSSQTVGELEGVVDFQRECQLLTKLRHPNLVDVYDYGVISAGQLYFTMAWIEGEGLESLMGQLVPVKTVDIVVSICRALAYLHTRGIVHGDLRPANVLVSDGQVKVVDFGVALACRSPEERAQYYAPCYVAPEIKTQATVDGRADLYSLGALWYALLTGQQPRFTPGMAVEGLISARLAEVLTVPGAGDVSSAIGDVIARLLAQEPNDRYASAGEVILAINEAMGHSYQLETRETAESYASHSVFTGRDDEMDALWEIWEQARDGGGLAGVSQVVLIGGEGGVGKSRLVEELGGRVVLEGARVVVGRCVESGGAAYHPWREVLRILLCYVEDAGWPGLDLARIGPILAALLPEMWDRAYMNGLEAPIELDSLTAQQRLNDAIAQVLMVAAQLRPFLVVVEDAHWADEASLALLDFWSRLLETTGMLVCVTYQDDAVERDHLLRRLDGQGVERLALQNLSPQATMDLVGEMLGLAQLPERLANRILQTTEGNPFFVQEVVRSLVTDGVVLKRTVDGWRVDGEALEEARLPDSIQQVMWDRLVDLKPETRQVLQWAAVMGSTFWDGALVQVTGLRETQVHTALREMEWLELVQERAMSAFPGEREYIFSKAAVQEVSYDQIPLEERQACHRLVAVWFISHEREQVSEYLGVIAGHLEAAGQDSQAVDYLRRAGASAAEQFANAEAMAYYSRALALLPENALDDRYDVLRDRERICDLQGLREAQGRDVEALGALAQVLEDDRRRIEAALRRANYAFVTGAYVDVLEPVRSAVQLAWAAGAAHQEAQGHLCWGRALWRQGNYEESRSQYTQALALSQEAGMRQIEADCLRYLGLVAFYQGDYEEARRHFEQALAIERALGDRRDEGRVLIDLGIVARRRGDYQTARSYLEPAIDICGKVGDRENEGRALGNLGTVFMNLGDYARAEYFYQRSLQIAHEVSNRGGESFRCYNLGLLSHLQGDHETAQQYNERALRISQEIGERDVQGYAWTGLGHALVSLGRWAAAADAYQRALAVREALGQPHLAVESRAGLVRVALNRESLDEVRSHVDAIRAYLDERGERALHGAEEPFRVYLTFYRALSALDDPEADSFLTMIGRLLRERADRIEDDEMRRSFLMNVAAHREVAKLGSEMGDVDDVSSAADEEVEMDEKVDEQARKEQLRQELKQARAQIAELKEVTQELTQTEKTLWESEERFRSIAETANDVIIIFDTQEHILYRNRIAQDTFGYLENEAQGHLLASILSDEFYPAFHQAILDVVETGESDLIGQVMEVTGMCKDGSSFPLELSLAAWRTGEGVFFTAIGRDISERKAAEEQLKQAYAEVERRVEERTTALEKEVQERERLQQEMIEAQRRALRELSTPIIPVMDRILVMPLIGSIDSKRALDITRALLAGVSQHRAKVVILDITGVAVVDSGVAEHLNKTIQAARLKGAHTIVTGISDAVAETIVDLGIEWQGIETLADLQTGLVAALATIGLHIK